MASQAEILAPRDSRAPLTPPAVGAARDGAPVVAPGPSSRLRTSPEPTHSSDRLPALRAQEPPEQVDTGASAAVVQAALGAVPDAESPAVPQRSEGSVAADLRTRPGGELPDGADTRGAFLVPVAARGTGDEATPRGNDAPPALPHLAQGAAPVPERTGQSADVQWGRSPVPAGMARTEHPVATLLQPPEPAATPFAQLVATAERGGARPVAPMSAAAVPSQLIAVVPQGTAGRAESAPAAPVLPGAPDEGATPNDLSGARAQFGPATPERRSDRPQPAQEERHARDAQIARSGPEREAERTRNDGTTSASQPAHQGVEAQPMLLGAYQGGPREGAELVYSDAEPGARSDRRHEAQEERKAQDEQIGRAGQEREVAGAKAEGRDGETTEAREGQRRQEAIQPVDGVDRPAPVDRESGTAVAIAVPDPPAIERSAVEHRPSPPEPATPGARSQPTLESAPEPAVEPLTAADVTREPPSSDPIPASPAPVSPSPPGPTAVVLHGGGAGAARPAAGRKVAALVPCEPVPPAPTAPLPPPRIEEQIAAAIDRAEQALARAEKGGEESAQSMREAAEALALAERLAADAHRAAERRADLPAGAGVGPQEGPGSLGEADSIEALVQERINHVARLIGSAVARRVGRGGVARVHLWIDPSGYVRRQDIEVSAGSPRLDAEIPAILHLAEPYPGGERAYHILVPFAMPAYGSHGPGGKRDPDALR